MKIREIYWYTPIIRKINHALRQAESAEKELRELRYKQVMAQPMIKLSSSHDEILIGKLEKLLRP